MDDLLLDFHSRPEEESLLALLRGLQDRIYNICFQVLRHPQDSKDAAQEVVLEVTEGCARISTPSTFRCWV